MPGLDVTPVVPAGRQVIQAFGDGRFRIADQVHEGPVIVFPSHTRAWPVDPAGDLRIDSFHEVVRASAEATEAADLLIVGCGPVFMPPPAGLRAFLKERSLVLEWMDSRAACRTFNVLLGEERRVVAAILSVD